VVGSMILTVTFSRGTPAQPNRLLPQWSDAGRVSEAGGARGEGGGLTCSDHWRGLGEAVPLQDWDADVFEELDDLQTGRSATRADVLQATSESLSHLLEDDLRQAMSEGRGRGRTLSASLNLNSSQEEMGRPYSALWFLSRATARAVWKIFWRSGGAAPILAWTPS
jgi:hypothetical protein